MSIKDEFKVHHHVSELMKRLGVLHLSPVGAEFYTDTLLKNMTPYITTQTSSYQAKRKIAELTSKPIEFLAKFDELKAKNTRNLDQLVFFLSKLVNDTQTKTYLEANLRDAEEGERALTLAQHQEILAQLPPSTVKMTTQELNDLKERLMCASTDVNAPGMANILAQIGRERPLKRNITVPHQPDWLHQRPALTMDFMSYSSGQLTATMTLDSLTPAVQEQTITEDILWTMQGIDGTHIVSKPMTDKYGQREFCVDQSLDASYRELVDRILPLCSNYSTIVRFIEEKSAFEYGLVNQALSSALRSLIKDYFVLIAQLEFQQKQGKLTLQKLWFYLQPTMRTFDILASVANAINRGSCIGGAVLSLLHEKMANLIGDEKGHELCLYLTQMACVPYFEILEKWIYKGIVCDPYSEFLIEENETIQKEALEKEFTDEYWEGRYIVCRERIPVFLELVADKILNTGKYLNVVRVCGMDVQCPHAKEMIYSVKEKAYYEHIDNAYTYASKLLLDMLITDKKLLARIRSIKHYFLLDKGDFMVQFMDMTEDEMRQDIDDIMPTRLESLLELALRTSTANVDPYKDDLRVDLLPYDLITQLFKIITIDTKHEKDYRIDPIDLRLSGLESFSFDYVVKWPVSLVLSRKVLTRYQILFRHLFYCKHVERQLCNVWVASKQSKNYTVQSTRWYLIADSLRHQMLNFVQNFEYYMMFEVIEHHWHIFNMSLETVTNIDEVLLHHTEFLNMCLKDCMLTNTELLKIVHKLMMVCVTFCNFIQRLNQTTVTAEQDQPTRVSTLQAAPSLKERQEDILQKKTTVKIFSEHVGQMGGSDNFERTIGNFHKNFASLLMSLLDKILDSSNSANCGDKLFYILYRLDFNGFYADRLHAASLEKGVQDHFDQLSDTGSTHSVAAAPPAFTSQHPDTARYVPGVHTTPRDQSP